MICRVRRGSGGGGGGAVWVGGIMVLGVTVLSVIGFLIEAALVA